MKKNIKKELKKNGAFIIKEKLYCPVCGSTFIKKDDGHFICSNCKSVFIIPKRTQIKLQDNPKYIR